METIITSIVKSIIDCPAVSGIVDDRVFHWQAPATAELPALTWNVADIRPAMCADNSVVAEEYVIILDAFCRGSPRPLAEAAVAAMRSIGFVQEYWSDVPDEDGVNQITMRFKKNYERG